MPGTLLQLAWNRYLLQLQKRPLQTKALTSAFVAACSDVIAQRLVTGKYQNWQRTLALALYGLIWNGPSAHFWQTLMEAIFPGKSDLQVIRKTLVDQLTYGPVCNLLFMSFATIVLERKSMGFLRNKIQRDYPSVQLNGWRLWPLASLINYKFVPLKLRVLFINLVALFWSIYLLLRTKQSNAGPALRKLN